MYSVTTNIFVFDMKMPAAFINELTVSVPPSASAVAASALPSSLLSFAVVDADIAVDEVEEDNFSLDAFAFAAAAAAFAFAAAAPFAAIHSLSASCGDGVRAAAEVPASARAAAPPDGG